MPAAFCHLSRVLNFTVLLLAVGCGEEATSPADAHRISLIIVSGNNQSGIVGEEMPLPLVVKATNANGSPAANLTVDFRVTSGNGSMYAVAVTTNNTGLARNYWTLGTSTAVAHTVEVRTILSNGTKQVLGNFNATPLPGPATQLMTHAGDGQITLKGTAVPIAPSVRAADQYDNPVPNHAISFAVSSGAGSVSGASQLSNSAGVATLGSWTVGPTFGPNTLTATAAGSGIIGNPVVFDATSSDWDIKASMPTPRANLGVGVTNGYLYAVGGFVNADVGTVEVYNPISDSWTSKASMPTTRSHLGIGVVDGVLYAVGGVSVNGGTLGSVEAYDPAINSWTVKASMPTPRYGLSLGVINGILYAVGGFSQYGGPVGTVEAYDPATDSWTTMAPMPTARSGLSVEVINGVLYAVGGEFHSNLLGSVEAYDQATDSWSTKSSMSVPRSVMGTGVINGVLYAIGGFANGVIPETVEAYDPATNTWTMRGPLRTPRYAFGAGVVNGLLYTVGGSNSQATVESLMP